MNALTLSCGLSFAFTEKKLKPDFIGDAFGKSFIQTQGVTPARLIDHLLTGEAAIFGKFKGNTRRNNTFISAQAFALDLDFNGVNDALESAFVRQYAALVYATPSSGKDGVLKCRIVFFLDQPSEGLDYTRALIEAVTAETGLPKVDRASYKPAQPYFGSLNRIEQPYINPDAVLPLAVANALTVPLLAQKAALEAAFKQREMKPLPPNSSRAEKIARNRLDKALNELASAAAGDRHDILIAKAFYLFGMLAGGWPLTDSDITSGLLAASHQNGAIGKYGEADVIRCINDMRRAAKPIPVEIPAEQKPRSLETSYVNVSLQNEKQFPPAFAPVTVEKPTPAQIVNARYLSDAGIHTDQDTAIRSPLGSGKTQFVIDEINRQQPERVLFNTYLQSLTENATDRLSAGVTGAPFEHYLAIPNNYKLGSINRLVCSLNSIYRLENAAPYDLVIIDEIEQVLSALWGGTMKGAESDRAYQVLVDTLKRAKRVIVLDAHLSRESIDFLQGIGRAPLVIENTYRPERPTLKLYQYESALLDAARACAEANPGLPVVIPTTSASAARKYRRLFEGVYGIDAVRLVYGGNSHEKEARDFLKNINTELPKLRVFIASPTVGTGVDVTCDVAGVFGYFPGKHLAPPAMLQQLGRYRNARAVSAHIPHTERNATGQAADLLARTRHKIARTRALSSTGQDVTDTQAAITRLWASFEAQHNRLTNHPLPMFAALAGCEGFVIEWAAGRAESMQTALKDAKDQQKLIDDSLTLTLAPISNDELDNRRETGKLLEIDRWANRRWKIEDTTGQDISEALIERYGSKSQRAGLVRLTTYLHGGLAEAARVDRLETDKLPFKRSFSALQQDFISGLIERVFRLKGRAALQSTEEITADEITDRVASYLEDNRATIEALDDSHTGLSETPIATTRRMLKRALIFLTYRRVRRDGQRLYVYSLNQNSMGVALADADLRQAALEKRLSQNLQSNAISPVLGHTKRLTPPGQGWRLATAPRPSQTPPQMSYSEARRAAGKPLNSFSAG